MIRCTLSTQMGKRRMRIADVARATGLHRETVSQLYHDRKKRYSQDMLNSLCRALNCQPHDLLEYIDTTEDNFAGHQEAR